MHAIQVMALTVITTPVFAEAPQELPDVTVSGMTHAESLAYPVNLHQTAITTSDTATLLQRAPGANINQNGALTGIAQYRGMYADRVNVVVDGMHINSGGPNGMDPALSYIPRSQLQSLEVVRGIAPVSSGTESIGGTIIAHSKLGEFGSKDIFENKLNFVLGVADVNTSNTGNLLINRANKNHCSKNTKKNH